MAIKFSQTDSYRRTRRDHALETAEDYVEAIAAILTSDGRCRIVDLARRFAVSHVTVTKIISRLTTEGLVETQPYRPITLSPTGERMAKMASDRHETVYRFLLAIGVDATTASLDAEGIEHHVSPKTLAKMKQFAASKTTP